MAVAARKKVTKKIRREDLKPGENLCDYCTGKCCRYFALAIDTPTTWRDFDNLRWYLLHGGCAVFVENGVWYLLVYGNCKHLRPDYKCGIYEVRPMICRGYSTDSCEYEDLGCYEKFFETSEQVLEYMEALFPPSKRPKCFQTAQPLHETSKSSG